MKTYGTVVENRDGKKINQVVTGDDIENVVSRAGVSKKMKGYKYITDAVSMVREDDRLLYAVVNKLYPKVAEKNNTTPSRVERDIRYAIKRAEEKKQFDEDIFYENVDERMTNKKFIADVAGIRI